MAKPVESYYDSMAIPVVAAIGAIFSHGGVAFATANYSIAHDKSMPFAGLVVAVSAMGVLSGGAVLHWVRYFRRYVDTVLQNRMPDRHTPLAGEANQF